MRYTRVGRAAWLIAIFLIGTAVAFAFWRSASPDPPRASTAGPSEVDSGLRGAELFATECAGCHSMSEFLSFQGDANSTLQSSGGRDYLARFLLDGNFRIIENGTESFEPGHPPFDHLTDTVIADILNYMLSGESGGEPLNDPGYTAAEIESLRAQ